MTRPPVDRTRAAECHVNVGRRAEPLDFAHQRHVALSMRYHFDLEVVMKKFQRDNDNLKAYELDDAPKEL